MYMGTHSDNVCVTSHFFVIVQNALIQIMFICHMHTYIHLYTPREARVLAAAHHVSSYGDEAGNNKGAVGCCWFCSGAADFAESSQENRYKTGML